MQFHHHGYVSGDPRVQPAAGVGLDRPDELPDEVDVLDRRHRAGRDDHRRAAVAVPGHHHADRRPPRGAARDRPGGRDPAAQRRDVPGVRLRRPDRRGVLPRHGGLLLAPGPGRPDADRPRRADARRPVRDQRVPAPVRQPGARARLLRRVHGERPDADDARLRLRVPRPRDRPTTASTRSRSTSCGPPATDAGQAKVVRARYVVGADGAHSGVRRSIGCTPKGGSGGPRVGRHGRPRRDRLPGHPPQVRDPVRLGRQHPAHPARGRPPVPHVRRPGRGPAARHTTPCAARPSSRSSPTRTRSCARTRST